MSNFSRSQGNLACGLLSLSLLLFRASGANAEAPPAKGESARISAEATPVDNAPKLDGTLNDPLWQSAKPITEFRQREPHEGEPPTEKTEVRILYTRHAVYFGIYCYDSESSRIIATELRRDVSQDLDDHFEILIDSNQIAGAHTSSRSIPLERKMTASSSRSKETQMEETSTGVGTECGRPRHASLPTDGPRP